MQILQGARTTNVLRTIVEIKSKNYKNTANRMTNSNKSNSGSAVDSTRNITLRAFPKPDSCKFSMSLYYKVGKILVNNR